MTGNDFSQPIERAHVGPRMSKIVRYGGLVFLCGQTSSGSGLSGIADQTNEVLRRVDMLLKEAGSDRSKLLSVTVHLKSIADFPAMNECWERWLDGYPPPARTTVEARLAADDLLVELTVTAAA